MHSEHVRYLTGRSLRVIGEEEEEEEGEGWRAISRYRAGHGSSY